MLVDERFELSVPVTPPTSYAVTGVCCYDSTVFDVIPTLEPSARGELEITDVNNYYVAQGTPAGVQRHQGLLGRCRGIDKRLLRRQRLRARPRCQQVSEPFQPACAA